MASFSRMRFKRDTGLVTRMYFTMFMLGILYGVFALFLMAVNFPIILIGVIVAVMVGVQYFLSDRMIMWSTGAKEVKSRTGTGTVRDGRTRSDEG